MSQFPDDDPRHGDYAGVQHHFTTGVPMCDACRDARFRYTKRLRRRIAAGERNRVPLGEEAHRLLVEVGPTQVANLAGLYRNGLYRLVKNGPEGQVLRSTRDAILAVRPSWTYIGVQRRVQALMALGYSGRVLAERLEVDYDGLLRLARRDVRVVKQTYAPGIVALYDELADTPPKPSAGVTLARKRALELGYVPPLAWDDIDLDETPADTSTDDLDPVDEVAVRRRMNGDRSVRLNYAEQLALIAAWTAEDRSLNECERVTGINPHRTRRKAS